jgi:hypothetical protein
MKTCLTALLFTLFVAAAALAQAPDTLWTRAYGGPNQEQANAVCRAANGDFLLAGWTMPSNQIDFFAVRISSFGDTLWTRSYGGTTWDIAYSACPTSDGGFALAGYTTGATTGADYYLIKINAQGDTLWTRTYGGIYSDVATAVRQLPDGGYMLAGTSASFGSHQDHVYLIRTNAQGDTLWTHTYDSGHPEHTVAAQPTTDGGYIIAATSYIQPTVPDIYIVKTNSVGDTLWTRLYGGPRPQSASSVQQCSDGGYIIGGTDSTVTGGQDFLLIRTDDMGVPLWSRTYGYSGIDIAASARQCPDGGFVVVGSTNHFGSNDFLFYRAYQNGDTMWSKRIGGSAGDTPMALEAGSDGSFLAVGYTSSYGHGLTDFYATLLAGTSGFRGVITDVTTHHPVRNAVVSILGQFTSAVSDSLGRYYIFLPAGTYDVALSGQCVGRDTVLSQIVLSDSVTTLNFQAALPNGIVDQSSVSVVAHNHVPATGNLLLRNSGVGILDFSIVCTTQAPPSHWLSVSPAHGSISPDDSLDVSVEVHADTSDNGVYDFLGFLDIHMNSCPDSVAHVPVIASVLDAQPSTVVPRTFSLSAYPNPFNPRTSLRFELPQTGEVSLILYDITGREVERLAQGALAAGVHTVSFDGSALSSGLYFARLTASQGVITRKLLLIR